MTTTERTTARVSNNEPPLIYTPDDDDEDYTDEDDETPELPTTTIATTTTILQTTTTIQSTTPFVEVTSETDLTSIDSDYDDQANINKPPVVIKRIKKLQATSGKAFIYTLEGQIFDDDTDGENLKLELLDKNEEKLLSTSWIRFNPTTKEIYGLPLENDVGRHEFKLRATDSEGEYAEENVDITVQQHKSYRSVNHEIFIQVRLDQGYESAVDWMIRLSRGIVDALKDDSIGSIIVRDVRPNKYEQNLYTFIYTNDTLPKDRCPKAELQQLMQRLTKEALNSVMRNEITVRNNIEKELVGSCVETSNVPPPSQPNVSTKNFPPTVRNSVDNIPATAGQLLVYEVPKDTFYDPEDLDDLKLTLLDENRAPLEPTHWLQFDAKNREFYGVPSIYDNSKQYILVAADKQGLTANDALMVEISNTHSKRDYSATFEYQLDMPINQFQNAATKRKFIERIAQYFHERDTEHIVVKSIKKLQYSGSTSVIIQNTTLQSSKGCPNNEIKALKSLLVRQDGAVRDDIKAAIGSEFNVQKITISPAGMHQHIFCVTFSYVES